MTTLIRCALCATFAFASPLLAQTTTDWDTDADGSLSRDEWNTGIDQSTAFTDWDADSSGMIESAEYAGGSFDRFDMDGDGTLTTTEWDDGIDRAFGEQGADLDYATWDANSDGTLDRDEFTAGYESQGMFDTMRTDAQFDTTMTGLSQDEFNTSMFDAMDANDDDMLSQDENTWMD
ncbi:hypothetical protein [Wenxinia saemankumensis]|uniref:EF hand n=1 Tax=Wenxinia saemankumensis TaxID=1447782 RepID=A0A1M5ZYI1_9RHOB|nr:hypothetical protein [Wenxinia saemankumensis]SHI29238.1 EF hand [Wenxinia saemankumensis]